MLNPSSRIVYSEPKPGTEKMVLRVQRFASVPFYSNTELDTPVFILPNGIYIPAPPGQDEMTVYIEPEHEWTEPELLDRLRLEGYDDPKWETYRESFAPVLKPYLMKIQNMDWFRVKRYRNLDATLTHEKIMRMLAGIDEVWYSTKRLFRSGCWMIVFDIEDGWSNQFYLHKDELLRIGTSEARTRYMSESLGSIPHLIIRTGGRGYHVIVYLDLKTYLLMYEYPDLQRMVRAVLEDAEVLPRKGRHFARVPFGPGSGIVTSMPTDVVFRGVPYPFVEDGEPVTFTRYQYPMIENAADNLEALDRFVNEHVKDFPTAGQLYDHLKNVWTKGGTLSLPKMQDPNQDKQFTGDLWDTDASYFVDSNEASMFAIRTLVFQGYEDDEVLAEAEDWLRKTGSGFSQVRDERAFNKLSGILQDFRGKVGQVSDQPRHSYDHANPPDEFVAPDERTRLHSILGAEDEPRAIRLLDHARRFLYQKNLDLAAEVPIHRDLWFTFGCSKKKRATQGARPDPYYTDFQGRMIAAGILEVADAGYQVGQRSKTYRLGPQWRCLPLSVPPPSPGSANSDAPPKQ